MNSQLKIELDAIFPLHLRINRQGTVCALSSALKDEIGNDSIGQLFTNAFNVIRPRVKDPSQSPEQLFLFRTLDDRYAMRGQIRTIPEMNGDLLMLVTPWMTWMLENHSSNPIVPHHFPAVDAQMELQIYLSSQHMMMDDLQKLLDQLKLANKHATVASEAKSEFINHVSHELRTPLNGITGAVELLSQNNLDQESMTLVDIIQRSSAALLSMINQILEYSNSASGSEAITLVEFNPRQLCQDVMDLLTVEAFRMGVSLTLASAEQTNWCLLGDVVKLENILLRLVASAMEQTRSEMITIHYQVTDTDYVDQSELTIGITSSENQIDSSEGFGLSIAKTELQVLDGVLGQQDSLDGNGNHVWFKVPVIRLAEPAPEKKTTIDSADIPTSTILIVDDNSINLKLARLQLERLGMTVHTAESGGTALEKCKERSYELILMDIQMPDLNGMDTARLLRQIPAYADTPIIAWTANASESEALLFNAAGITDILSKPTDKSSFSAVLSRWLPPGSSRLS